MQGILMSHFNQVKKYLHDLRQLEQADASIHLAAIIEHEQKLLEIYTNYKAAFSEVESIIKEFNDHKKSVRRLITKQKRHKKFVSTHTRKISKQTSIIA